MIKLSVRLLSIVDFVSSDDLIIDVGCDHAYLAIYLCELYNYNHIYVSDINEKALQNGIKNIEQSKLTSKVIPLLGDGISIINDIAVNTLIISGLGAFSIINIVNHPNLKKIKKIIIQSNTDHYLIRKHVTKLGFIIKNEKVVKDNNKYYSTILFERGQEKLPYLKLKYGFHHNLDYYQYLCNQHKAIYSKLNINHPFKKLNQIIIILIYKVIIFKNKNYINH